MSSSFFVIFTDVVAPVLGIVGLGALVQRFHRLDIGTLTRLNIYLFVPAFLFVRVYDSSLTWAQIGGIALGMLGPIVLLGILVWAALRGSGTDGRVVAAVLAGGLVLNAGNFGIPVAELMYRGLGGSAPVLFPGMTAEDGVAVQAVVVALSNLSIWCAGYVILSLAKGDGLRGAFGYLKLPMLYVLAAAFLMRDFEVALPRMVAYPIRSIANAAVPVMLITLAAQLVQRARWPRWRLVAPVVALKLAVLPVATWAFVWAVGLWPWPGAQLVIAAAAPTAVNTLLITLEMDGDADLAADFVFWSTLFSAATVTVVAALVTAAAAV